MVATDWTPFVQVVGGAAAAIGGGVAAAWLQGKSQERIEQRRLRREEDVERQQRRERAAGVLAEVSRLLVEVSVQQTLAEQFAAVGGRLQKQLHDDVERLEERQKAASEQLILLAIREPSPRVRQLARDLERAMSSAFGSLSMTIVGMRFPHVASAVARPRARSEENHRRALALLDELVDVL